MMSTRELSGEPGQAPLGDAYFAGAFSKVDFEARLAVIAVETRLASQAVPVGVDEVAALLGDLPAMWAEAEPDERRRLIAPLIERAYADVETRRIAGIVPVAPFRSLLDAGMQRTADCSAVLVAPSHAAARGEILELVETGESRTPRPESLRLRSATGVVSGYSRRPSSTDEGPAGQPQ